MAVLVVTVLLIGGFWLWARGETLKRQKRKVSKYDYYRPPAPINLRQKMTQPQPVTSTAISVVIAFVYFASISNGYGFWPQLSAIGNSGQGTGYGEVDDRNLANFPPPGAYQEVGGTASTVTFINGSPDALNIVLTKDTGERVELKMPACKECTTYSRDNSPPYGAVGTPITFQIPPGVYKARGNFFGTHNTKGFQSDWQLAQGWEYRSCIYTLDEVNFY
jgi:hypothetical protein